MDNLSYTTKDNKLIGFKLGSKRTYDLENRMGLTIPQLVNNLDKFNNCIEIIAASVSGNDDYNACRDIAFEIYDDMVESGKLFTDFQFLTMDILVDAGFMKSEIVRKAKEGEQKLDGVLAAVKKQSKKS